MAHNKKTAKRLPKRSPLLKVLVVALVIGVGAVVLPLLHADSSAYKAPNLTVQPGTGTNQLAAFWSLNGAKQSANQPTGNGWQLTYSAGGGTPVTRQISDPSLNGGNSVLNLSCGVTYNFALEVTANGVQDSPDSRVSATVNCGSISASLAANSSTADTVSWSTTSNQNYISSFDVYLFNTATSASSHASAGASSRSVGFGVSCGNTYIASVVQNMVGGSNISAQTQQVSSPSCPAAPSPPPSSPPASPTSPTTPSSGGGSSGGSSSGSGSTTKKSTTTTKSTAAPTAAATVVLPGVPTDFTATVQSSKVVALSWNADSASAGIKNYILQRSTDDATWSPLATVTDVSYNDTTAGFNATYYYELQAVDNNGNVSGAATAEATTSTFQSSGNTIRSSDKVVTITIVSGTFDQPVNCTINSSSDLSSVPKGEAALVGPYDVVCVGADGSLISNFAKPLQVSMNLSSVDSGYVNITGDVKSGNAWKVASKSAYDAKTHRLSFALTSDNSFAAFGQRHKSAVGVIFLIFFLIALLVGGFFGLRWFLGRRAAMTGPAERSVADDASLPSAAQQFEEAVAKPNCTHLAMAQQVVPQSEGCQECQAAGTHWKALRICLICGHVGCSDDSDQQHALKHFQETGHPLIYDFNDPAGNQIGWCYIDQTYI